MIIKILDLPMDLPRNSIHLYLFIKSEMKGTRQPRLSVSALFVLSFPVVTFLITMSEYINTQLQLHTRKF